MSSLDELSEQEWSASQVEQQSGSSAQEVAQSEEDQCELECESEAGSEVSSVVSSVSSSVSSSVEGGLRVVSLNVGQGWRSKAHKVLRQCSKVAADVVALQEIGEPVQLQQQAAQFGFHAVLCGGKRTGVCLLIAERLVPWIRQVMRSEKDGRLVGALLEVQGVKLVLACVYMPTGLDFSSSSSSSSSSSVGVDPTLLYKRLHRWMAGSRQVVLGDFNETLSTADRLRPSPRCGQWISQMPAAGLLDAYRIKHPQQAGFTHFTTGSGGAAVQSRLDYVFVGGMTADAVWECEVELGFQVSHHRMVWAELQLQLDLSICGQVQRLQLPNIRFASEQQKEDLVQRLDLQVSSQRQWLESKAAGVRADVDEMFAKLSDWALQAANSAFGRGGGVAGRSGARLQLARQRKLLCRCRVLAKCLHAAGSSQLSLGVRWSVSVSEQACTGSMTRSCIGLSGLPSCKACLQQCAKVCARWCAACGKQRCIRSMPTREPWRTACCAATARWTSPQWWTQRATRWWCSQARCSECCISTLLKCLQCRPSQLSLSLSSSLTG